MYRYDSSSFSASSVKCDMKLAGKIFITIQAGINEAKVLIPLKF